MATARGSRWITIAAVKMLAAIAAVVSYSHMFDLAQRHGEPEWQAALSPLSVDGMTIESLMALLADARRGRSGSLAFPTANVAVAEPTLWSGVIHAWSSFALAGAFELLMQELRREQSARPAHAVGEPNRPRRVVNFHPSLSGPFSNDVDTARGPPGVTDAGDGRGL